MRIICLFRKFEPLPTEKNDFICGLLNVIPITSLEVNLCTTKTEG